MKEYITPEELLELANIEINDSVKVKQLIRQASTAIDKEVIPNVINGSEVPEEIKQAVAWQCEHLEKYSGFIGVGSFSLGKMSMGGQAQNSNNLIPEVSSKVHDLLLSNGWLYAGVGGYYEL
ncbi:head-tail connector protein [Listeria kieliensis]